MNSVKQPWSVYLLILSVSLGLGVACGSENPTVTEDRQEVRAVKTGVFSALHPGIGRLFSLQALVDLMKNEAPLI